MDTWRIAVQIPPDYHGYLDTGDEGFFIPLSFTFPGLEEQGAQAVMVSRPVGERDEVVHATVLRGSGEFAFRIEAIPTAAMTAAALPMTLRYQICHDVTKICYPPQEVAVPLHATTLTGGMSRSVTPVTFSRQPPSASPWSVEISENLHWWRDFAMAQQRARAEQKPLFVDFYAIWCANCKAFQQLTVSDAQLNAALQEAILVKIYDTDADFQTLQREPHYPELRGVGGQPLLPLFAIYAAQGVLVWKGQDYQAVHTIVAQLERAKRVVTP